MKDKLTHVIVSALAGAVAALAVNVAVAPPKKPLPDDAFRKFQVGDVYVIELQYQGQRYYSESHSPYFRYYTWYDAEGNDTDYGLREVYMKRVEALERKANDSDLQHRRGIISAANVSTQAWIK